MLRYPNLSNTSQNKKMASTEEIIKGLYLIDIPQPSLNGFEKFISAWFLRDIKGRRILVDPGPASSISALCCELEKLTDGLDFILLTHIHLDHSGGTGQLLQRYPGGKVLVSDRGKKHLVSPEKLWKASGETLGKVAEAYGEPLPVSPGSILDGGLDGIEIFETPGHAPHHISFRVPFGENSLLFVGEAAGMTLPGTTSRYLRPTTPPKFDGDAAFSSLSLLSRICSDKDVLCYGHFGIDKDACGAISAAREQLRFWRDFISEKLLESSELSEIREILLKNDPMLAPFAELPDKFKARELNFMDNTLQGFIGWCQAG